MAEAELWWYAEEERAIYEEEKERWLNGET
jgi:hypothetical protein